MTRYYDKDPAMVSRQIAGELILVPIRQNVGDLQCMYTLNQIGSRIWDLLTGGKAVEDIVSVLTQEYEVESEQAEADVADLLSQLEDIGAIVPRVEGD